LPFLAHMTATFLTKKAIKLGLHKSSVFIV
jgi:hypothetical protein